MTIATPVLNANASLGTDIRVYDITFITGDTTTGAVAHGLPFTPSYAVVQPVSGIGTAIPTIAVTLTSTTFTITKSGAANTAGVYKFFVGRITNPQTER